MPIKKINLFDDQIREHLYPLTMTRPASLLRTGIMTNVERWKLLADVEIGYLTIPYLSGKYNSIESCDVYCNGRYLASEQLIKQISALSEGDALWNNDELVGYKSSKKISSFNDLLEAAKAGKSKALISDSILSVKRPWELFQFNEQVLAKDFELITKDRTSESASASNTILGNNIFIEPGAKLEACTINTLTGPVYIGRDAEVMEGSVIRGPFALCEHSTLKLSTKIYGATTIGPHCKVGGEVNNSIITGYSNKAHDGFLGNSVIGEWCNLGADTNNSNLKNNYTEVKLYSYVSKRFEKTGLQFCGLIMGDHSKCGINTMFNTGTVVGVNANIFGSGFPRNFIPSFSWGGAAGLTTYKFNDAMSVASAVMGRRNITLETSDIEILEYIFTNTESLRK